MSERCGGARSARCDDVASRGTNDASGIADWTFLSYMLVVNSDEFIRKVRRVGRKRRVETRLIRGVPKGGHATLFYGTRFTQVALHGSRREIPPKTLARMLKDLGLRKEDI